jgi:hypothetical protein
MSDKIEQLSKKDVNRAGDTLVKNPQDEQALTVLEHWRYLHSHLIDPKKDGLYQYNDSASAQVSSRLKRSISIIEKLKRFPDMKLSRMQDIIGARWVVKSDPSFFLFFIDELRNKKQYRVTKMTDYIETPRESGYRAVHFIYECQSPDTPHTNGLLGEMQLRTRPQHLWAMAVETVGMFYGQALKSSRGDQEWLDFFRLTSAVISTMEGTPVVEQYRNTDAKELRRMLHQQGHEQSFFSKLAAIRRIHDKDFSEDYEYWLLDLDLKKETCDIYGFKMDQIATAHEMYAAKEQTPACLRGDKQIVLVSTSSFKDLRPNYPSYFLDVAEFLEMIKTI